MTYLDFDRLAGVDVKAFRETRPYPWLNPEGMLTNEGYQRLVRTLPEPALFTKLFGMARSHGQYPHDRLSLDYREDLPVDPCWHEFVAELRGREYHEFISKTFDRRMFLLNFHWHYTPNGCSVSPHCDATRKLGSHIFYFNTAEDWDASWGGETLILDDHGRFQRKSAPAFEEFDNIIAGQAIGNRSLLFARRENSWHGVRQIRCPENRFRKVFIVVINSWLGTTRRRIVGALRGKQSEAYY